MANYYSVALNVLSGNPSEPEQLNLIEAALREPPVKPSSEGASSSECSDLHQKVEQPSADHALTSESPGQRAKYERYPFSFEPDGELDNYWTRRFYNRIRLRDTCEVVNRIQFVSQRFPSATFLLQYSDPMTLSGKLVIYDGRIVREVCDSRPSYCEWVEPNIFAPYETEHMNGEIRESFWNQWLGDLTAAVQQLKPNASAPPRLMDECELRDVKLTTTTDDID